MKKMSYPLERESREMYRYEIFKKVKIDKELYEALILIHKNKYHDKEYFQTTNKIAYLISEPKEDIKVYVYGHDFDYFILSVLFMKEVL